MPPSAPFALLRATPADLPSMALIFESAFAHIYFATICFPRERIADDRKREWLASSWGAEMAKAHTRHWKVVDVHSGEMVGWAGWDVPRVVSVEEREERVKEKKASVLPEGSVVELFDLKHGLLDEIQDQWVEPGSAYSELFCCRNPSILFGD